MTKVDLFFDFRDLYGKMVVESTHNYEPTGSCRHIGWSCGIVGHPWGSWLTFLRVWVTFDIDRPQPNLYVKKKNRNNFFLKIAALREKNVYIGEKNKESIYEVSEELAEYFLTSIAST